jgi:hypothetical protein
LVAVLLGCYRTGEANNPEIYADAAIAVLSDYPFDIARAVVDPRGGLPSRTKWLPTIAELKAACEEEMAPIYRAAERKRVERETLALRATAEIPEDERARVVRGFAELRERLGKEAFERDQELRARLAAKTIADNNADIEAEYRAMGKPPIRTAGTLISSALLKNLEERNQR